MRATVLSVLVEGGGVDGRGRQMLGHKGPRRAARQHRGERRQYPSSQLAPPMSSALSPYGPSIDEGHHGALLDGAGKCLGVPVGESDAAVRGRLADFARIRGSVDAIPIATQID